LRFSQAAYSFEHGRVWKHVDQLYQKMALQNHTCDEEKWTGVGNMQQSQTSGWTTYLHNHEVCNPTSSEKGALQKKKW